MDKEQKELQFIGFFGVWKESFKIIYGYRQIFIQLTLALILPLSFIYFAHTEINHFLTLYVDPAPIGNDTRSALSRNLAWYILIQVSYIFLLFVFSLLSTSAVVYTVACIYIRKTVSFTEVVRVVPKVWKRLMVTFLCSMAIMFIYNFITLFFAVLFMLAYPLQYERNLGTYIIVGAIFVVLYSAGLCYMGVVWQLANTISVLEESYGFQALRKSKVLMKGKMGISVGIFLIVNFCVGGAVQIFKYYDHSNVGMFRRVGFGVMSLLMLCIVNLVSLVVHTIFYLVCKSYHHEQIDKSALAEHLEVYHGEGYVLLKPKNIQMEQV